MSEVRRRDGKALGVHAGNSWIDHTFQNKNTHEKTSQVWSRKRILEIQFSNFIDIELHIERDKYYTNGSEKRKVNMEQELPVTENTGIKVRDLPGLETFFNSMHVLKQIVFSQMYSLFKPHGNTPDPTEPHLQYAGLCSYGYKEVLNNPGSLRILCADDDIWKRRRSD
ncbi:hypothetical protein BTVI_87011 [Pitangus sulphuratus]|nr:hypothetical protein BTVI_87011 [Pitangus sulphuratus]